MFYCPCCNHRVLLKVGQVKIPHFAHLASSVCGYASEGESYEHLLGKEQLYHWLDRQGYEVQLETYFPRFKQRADLSVLVSGQYYAIEFQCSVIALEEIKQRTLQYRRHHVTPIWILNSHHLKKKGYDEYSLSAFQFYTSSSSEMLPKILTYSPAQQQFTILHQLIPFSSRSAFAHTTTHPLYQISFEQLISESKIVPFCHRQWIKKKQKWCIGVLKFSSFDDPFVKALYENGLSVAAFPLEIGLPVPFMHLYETSAILWQFWLYVYVIHPKKAGDTITMQEWRAALIRCLKEKKIVLRLLPSVSSVNPFLAMEQYVCMLEKLDILYCVVDNMYVLQRKFELFNPADPQCERVFFAKVSSVYSTLLNKAMQREKREFY